MQNWDDVITIEESDSDSNSLEEIIHVSEENGKGEEISGFTLTEECNYEQRINEDNLIRRKRKAKRSSKSTTPDTTKTKFANQTKKWKNQKQIENTKILASSKNAKTILSKKKNNSNSGKREEKSAKKKVDSNFGLTTLCYSSWSRKSSDYPQQIKFRRKQ